METHARLIPLALVTLFACAGGDKQATGDEDLTADDAGISGPAAYVNTHFDCTLDRPIQGETPRVWFDTSGTVESRGSIPSIFVRHQNEFGGHFAYSPKASLLEAINYEGESDLLFYGTRIRINDVLSESSMKFELDPTTGKGAVKFQDYQATTTCSLSPISP